MTYLSDKECARIDDIQEVPEAAVEGCLEKGVGEESRSAVADHPPAPMVHTPQLTLITGIPPPPALPHVMNANEASLLSHPRPAFQGLKAFKVNS